VSTATEIEIKNSQAVDRLLAVSAAVGLDVNRMISKFVDNYMSREVCAKRARKLRKRGEDVAYSCRSKTGKARYRWTPNNFTVSWL
jgi:hypothetical protein